MMRQKSAVCLAVALMAAVAVPIRAAAWTGTIVTANERDNSLSFIDWPHKQQIKVPVPIAPHNVQVSADRKLVLAVGSGIGGKGHAGHGAAGRLVLIDPLRARPEVVATIALTGHPAHVVTDLQARLAYLTDAETNTVVVVDLGKQAVVDGIPVGKYPHGLRLSPDGREIYVANMRDASVSIIDAAARRQVARLKVGAIPVQVGFTPDGKYAFVSLNGENRIAIIDTEKRRVIARRPVGRGPVQVFSSGDGNTIYVANQGTEKRPDNRLSLVPVARAASPSAVETGAGAHGVAVSRDGTIIAVTNTYADTTSIIDAATATVLATIPVGAGPNGVTLIEAEPSRRP